MSMNFVDIAIYQKGIDLDKVFALNPLDGVIVKATEGTYYVNPMCDTWVQWLIANKKPWGFYHYLNGKDPVTEAQYFVKNTINYFGHGVPCADYEGDIVHAQHGGTYYLHKWLETVFKETGIAPMVYCNLGTIQADVDGFRMIAQDGYPLWLAQYASNSPIGFQPKPWQRGSYAPFDKITMHQYSGNGKISGYSGAIDLDIYYGTEEDWQALTGKSDVAPIPDPTPDPVPDMGRDAIVDAIIELLEKLR